MRNPVRTAGRVLLVYAWFLSGSLQSAGTTPGSDSERIASAMSAAPARMAWNAEIVEMQPDGSMRTIRPGNNGFTCMPDNPVTPGPDPMCMDRNALEWVQALVRHKPPPDGKMGFLYMLAGGTDASNTDPYAMVPSLSDHWINTGPHIMIVGADPAFYDQYPNGADPDTSMPYVMWPGTPYQHLMVPIR